MRIPWLHGPAAVHPLDHPERGIASCVWPLMASVHTSFSSLMWPSLPVHPSYATASAVSSRPPPIRSGIVGVVHPVLHTQA